MKDFIKVGDYLFDVKSILKDLSNKCPKPYYIGTYDAETSTFDDGVTLTFVVDDRLAFNNQSALGDVKVDVDIHTDGYIETSVNEYMDEDLLIKSILFDIGYDHALEDSEIKDIKKRASEYIVTHPDKDQWEYEEYEKELVADEYGHKLIDSHRYYMEYEGGFDDRYHIGSHSYNAEDHIYDLAEIRSNIKNELSLFPEISCDSNVDYDYDRNNFYIELTLCFNNYDKVVLSYYPKLEIYNYYVIDSNIKGENFESVKDIINDIYKQMSKYKLNELYNKYDEDIVLFYVYIRDIINKNEADSVKDILYKAIDNGKISQKDKDELGIEREDTIIRAIWESMCDQDFISEKQQKYVELAKRSLQ